MESVETLEKTTFRGRRFTRKQLAQIQETVQTFPSLSRRELAETICEHLDWKTARGTNKVSSALILLEELEAEGIIALPSKRRTGGSAPKSIALRQADPPISGKVEELGPITLQLATTETDRKLWKSYVESHHYLGYKRPAGAHLLYFVVSEKLQARLGCLSYCAGQVRSLAPRDEWIGWQKKHREKLLQFVLTQTRFLIFPWVTVSNLSSKVLSLSTKRIAEDWVQRHGYRPVLLETFVDTLMFSGSSYRAANWQYLGETKGRGHNPERSSTKTPKAIFVYPLQSDWRSQLTGGYQAVQIKKRYRNDLRASRTRSIGDAFVAMWTNVVDILHEVAQDYDRRWRVRKRVLGSLLLMLLIFRLVTSRNSQSYGTTIDDLWDSCDTLGLSMPQEHSVKPASFCRARLKLDECIFKRVNQEILDAYGPKASESTWHGHRLFAVDGSKLNLPRALKRFGYKTPSDNAHYPQGLLSCLYQLKSQLPYDFHLVPHTNERVCAKQHLDTLEPNDVVVYDRGYYSYVMLYQHSMAGVHALFRLQQQSNATIQAFIDSCKTDEVVTIYPGETTQAELHQKHPDIDIIPLKMRLLKYTCQDTTFCLGTTLVGEHQRYPLREFMDVYHARWGVEELYKISKRSIDVEDFHAKSERGVKQEVFAHFALITMTRLFANQADDQFNAADGPNIDASSSDDSPPVTSNRHKLKVNFKNAIHVLAQNIEPLLMIRDQMAVVVKKVFKRIVSQYQRIRPGRTFPRKSMRPDPRWRPSKKKSSSKNAAAVVTAAV
jgi:hypothetical protein